MATDSEKTKRRWGKSRHREKITIVDRMEIEDTLQKFAEEVKSFKDRHEVARTPPNNEPDLQQPELMSNFALIEALRKIKVPIPVYADGKPSRERLIYLFRQHVTPRPQRTRPGRRPLRRRDRKLKRVGGQTDAALPGKSEELEQDAMEVEGATESEDFWAVKGDGSWVLPLQRKRKNEVISSVSCGAPPEKKPPVPESPSKTLCSNLASMEVISPVTKEVNTKKIIKLKRPGRAVPATSS